jgi:hypothetical protein
MNKTGSNALWNELTPEQRKTLDDWLFEEKLSFVEVLPKAQSELGFAGSMSSLQRYYRRRKQERVLENLTELREEVAEIGGAGSDVGALRAANMKLLGGYLFQVLREAPEKVKEWAPVASLMVQNDHNEALRELKGEEHKIRREAMEFAKEKFQIDMIEQALKALPELIELTQARKDPEMKEYERNAYLNRVRRRMFGVVWEVRPESAEEEAEMIAARKAREARQAQDAERKEQREQERITGLETPTPSSPYYGEYLEWKAKQEGTGE